MSLPHITINFYPKGDDDYSILFYSTVFIAYINTASPQVHGRKELYNFCKKKKSQPHTKCNSI
jgi:hypothetical protein